LNVFLIHFHPFLISFTPFIIGETIGTNFFTVLITGLSQGLTFVKLNTEPTTPIKNIALINN
jgi:hypothetical protein